MKGLAAALLAAASFAAFAQDIANTVAPLNEEAHWSLNSDVTLRVDPGSPQHCRDLADGVNNDFYVKCLRGGVVKREPGEKIDPNIRLNTREGQIWAIEHLPN